MFQSKLHSRNKVDVLDVHRNITPRMKTNASIDKKVEKDLLIDLENIQWLCTLETFEPLINLLEKKYLNNH